MTHKYFSRNVGANTQEMAIDLPVVQSSLSFDNLGANYLGIKNFCPDYC